MTEDEAKEKWCPFSRAALGEDFDDKGIQLVAANRSLDYLMPHSCRCIGSDCMAWRQTVKTVGGEPETIDGATVIPRKSVVFGYCGLAGPDR